MRYLTILLLLTNCAVCQAQTDTVLDAYLATHKYTIQVDNDTLGTTFPGTAIPAMLARVMYGKQLFVYAEGFSHYLKLNKQLRRSFVEVLSAHGLKYCFEESARSWVVDDYLQMNDAIKMDEHFRRFTYYGTGFYQREKVVYQKGHYEYKAVDFERNYGFKRTLSMLWSAIDSDNRAALLQVAPYFEDTSYLTLSKGQFVKFYKQQQEKFYADSSSFVSLMGDKYPYFRYLMSDPKPSSYNNNRNKNMAWHLLQQIGENPDPKEVYTLSIGNGHVMYRDGVTKTTLGHLRDSRQLKGKIVLTTLYCEQCHAGDNSGNSSFKYLKGDVLSSFQKAANNAVVLFDLTELPAQYQYIRDKNDLIVYAKDQY